MTLKQNLASLVLAFLMAPAVMAAATPYSLGEDARIQTAAYSANQVFNVRAQVGKAVLIQLEADERMTGDTAALGMGDADAWNLAVKGNNIIFKPTAQSPATNMIVTTNKRTYVFALSLVGGKGKAAQTPTYVLRFSYPDSISEARAAEASKRAQANALLDRLQKVPGDVVNSNYWGKGVKGLAPTAVYDNGRFTYFSFDNGKDLPAIYKELPDGSEALLNTHMESDTVVVHEVAKQFILRLGDSVLGLENRGYDEQGRFNRTGTDDGNSVRIIK